MKANITIVTPVTYTTTANHVTTAVSQLTYHVEKARVAGAIGTKTGNADITNSDGNSINVDWWIPNWNQLSKGDRDKIVADKMEKHVKIGKGGKGGSYTSGNKILEDFAKKTRNSRDKPRRWREQTVE